MSRSSWIPQVPWRRGGASLMDVAPGSNFFRLQRSRDLSYWSMDILSMTLTDNNISSHVMLNNICICNVCNSDDIIYRTIEKA